MNITCPLRQVQLADNREIIGMRGLVLRDITKYPRPRPSDYQRGSCLQARKAFLDLALQGIPVCVLYVLPPTVNPDFNFKFLEFRQGRRGA